ncbi:THO complex subunit 2 [Macrosteles quadrilineatus]|uniref:THO complex subunit 2 n=1 Tax=Macrosteles quadrilineatus TaxID=74068 RepID=UPI0023E2E2DF|nr:THO complex subunit 2 [Macrosteles quadrilineatus]
MASDREMFKSWDKQGKHDFLKLCTKLCNVPDTSPAFAKTGYVSEFSRAVHNLIWSGVKGVLKKDAVVSMISELVPLHKDVASVILDVINVVDAETSAMETSGDERAVLGYIIKVSEKIFTDKLLKERLEIDSLQEFKVLNNRNFYTKFIKVKTKLYYKQRKFNLFREESEGYAKLCTELNQISSDNNVLEHIKSLIGYFNLDPNRVLDVMLDSFEDRPEQVDFFIPLIQNYMSDSKTLAEVIAFKFSFYPNSTIPHSLYIVTALMLQHGVISLDDIYPWLSPDDKIITRDWEKEIKKAKEHSRKLNILSAKHEKDSEQSEEKEDESDKFQHARNQKFGLCEALLEVGDWANCQVLSKRLPDFCVMDQPPIAKALCQLINSLIEPVYRKHSGLGPKIPGRPVPPPKSRLAPPQAFTLLDLRNDVMPMLYALGPALHQDPVLVYKIVRILRSAVEQAISDGVRYPSEDSLYWDTISLLDLVILPSLSCMDANCCVADHIWNVVKLFPYQTRYSLYSRWKNETPLHHAKLLRRKTETQKKIKNIMKRVTKETIKPMGRHIGKLTHSAPGMFFDYMLIQIQQYDNLIVPMVDALKYLTTMSYDVLGYCIIEALTIRERDRIKHDGTSISLWLQSLAQFCGYIFKKYNIELTGLMQYLANQLKMERSLDMLILNEVVLKMAGIEAAEEMSSDQLEAFFGGDLLKGEAGYFSQVRNTKRSSLRLKEALVEDNLAVALCLLMGQQRYSIIYRETDKSHLKFVGKLYDQCQDTLVQFGTFLGTMLSMEEYVTKLPSIHSMLQDYHIRMDVAFFLARPMFTHSINQKFEQLRKADPNSKKSTATKTAKYCEAVAEVMGPVADSVRPLHPPKVWEDISPQFLVTFWSLTMYDLFVPVQAYDREITKIKATQTGVMTSKDLPPNKQKKEIERYSALIEKLQDEKKKQQEHVDRVMARLKQEKDSWFLSRSAKSAKNETITQLLQLCLFPRCIFTTVDSLYCAKFVHILHNLQTANFSTLLCYDRLFCDITYSVTSCTENEANRYGRFLCAMLETVMRWHSKKEIFEEECASYPGFVTKFRVSNQCSENNDHVGYENYRHVCHKWHYKITKAIVVCLESKDYVQIRNSLIILTNILPHFPVLSKLSICIEKKIDKIKEDEKVNRQDLFTLAQSYGGMLKARAPYIMREADFHQVSDPKAPPKAAEPKAESTPQNQTSLVGGGGGSFTRNLNGDLKSDKTPVAVVSSTVKESSREKKMNRSSVGSLSPVKTETSGSAQKSTKDKSEKAREKELLEREKQIRKEERREEARREEAKKRAEEKSAEERTSRERSSDRYREDRFTEMPLSKDGELTTRGSYSNYYPSQDSQLSSVSNSSSGSLHHPPPDQDRDSKRKKVEASSSSKKHEERKVSSGEVPSNTSERVEKKERREKLKKSLRTPLDEEKELKKERKLNRKRDRAEEMALAAAEQKRRKSEEKGSSKVTSSHQNGDHGDSHRDKRQFQKEKSPYVRERERSHDREGRDKHRRSGDAKRR